MSEPGSAPGAPPAPLEGSDVGSRRERLQRDERLRRRADYLRCYRQGRRRQGTCVALHFVPNALGHPRLGITVSRKVGRSVVRQRVKRRIREIYRRWNARRSLPTLDLVVHVHPAAATAPFATLQAELERQLASLLPRVPPPTP